MHTKMSAFDGLSTPNNIIKRSKEYGWNAISIIDRYNVQSFPEAMLSSEKFHQKIIYGLEAEIIDRFVPLVLNPIDANLNTATYVSFDLETTGLYNEYDDIIEFGAIKIKNGAIIDRIDFFIKPSKPIPYAVSKLTRITNDMVANAISIKAALNKIID